MVRGKVSSMASKVKRSKGWDFWIDRGGTFTDLVALAPDGRLLVRKVLSEQPDTPGDPAVCALKALLEAEASDDATIEELRLGTTVAANATRCAKRGRRFFSVAVRAALRIAISTAADGSAAVRG